VRYGADGSDCKCRQPVIGPFGTKKLAEEELATVLARVGGPAQRPIGR
jgi:hypothetical protein